MNVILAKSAGFCFGVKRAVDTVYERILEKEPLYTFGPIIHNEEVVRDLEEKGVVVVNDVDELAGKPQGTVCLLYTSKNYLLYFVFALWLWDLQHAEQIRQRLTISE